MAGLYIHIPFCAKRCIYCDFFSNTEMKYKDHYLKALSEEIGLRKSYIGEESIETIYFGGGTPSLLNAEDFDLIFGSIQTHFDISDCKEITLEANPDDLTPEYIQSIRRLPFNRISMGIQSFNPDDLRFLNRRHSREQAIQAVKICKENGYTNLNIDLIYGLPGQTPGRWEENLEEVLLLDIPHISAYHLIYEEGTALYKLWEEEKISSVTEEVSLSLFSMLIDSLTNAGYQHYEISNFARPGYLSMHNSSYWTGKKYLGIGPSAHSYNGITRDWNISSLPYYLEGIKNKTPDIEQETLDINTRYNDYIVTRLRTMWGISYQEIKHLFGDTHLAYLKKQSSQFLQQGVLIEKEERLTLSRDGIFISDGIMRDLLWI